MVFCSCFASFFNFVNIFNSNLMRLFCDINWLSTASLPVCLMFFVRKPVVWNRAAFSRLRRVHWVGIGGPPPILPQSAYMQLCYPIALY